MKRSRNAVFCSVVAAILVALAHSMVVGCTPAQRGYRRMILEVPVKSTTDACASYTNNGLCVKKGGE